MERESSQYDVIVVGAGMGGLSAAAFLAKEGKRVLVLEKHDKPGGLVTSFTRKGLRFDCGLESLNELKPGDTIPQFLAYWGQSVETVKRSENVRVFVGGGDFMFRGGSLEEDIAAAFPHEKKAIGRFCAINRNMISELYTGGAPKPPYEMSLLEKIAFGARTALQRPTFFRYGRQDASVVLKKLFRDRRLMNAIYAKAMVEMVYMGYAYRWETIRRDELYYPVGGMQAIADRAVAAITGHGGQVLLNTAVESILIEGGRACGVRCADGTVYRAAAVVSNASPHHTANALCAGVPELDMLRREITKRKPFSSCMMGFVGVSGEYDFGGAGYIAITDETVMDMGEGAYTPENCPIAVIVSQRPEGQRDHSVIIIAPVPYEYRGNWQTEGGERGQAYRQLKAQAFQTVLDRVSEKLGEGFRQAILFTVPATPLTIERYTNSHRGSFMGWSIDRANYGRFLPQRTDLPGLFMVGQWVFPGFGVAGVMASGYYLAKTLLQADGIDLETRFREFFAREKEAGYGGQ